MTEPDFRDTKDTDLKIKIHQLRFAFGKVLKTI